VDSLSHAHRILPSAGRQPEVGQVLNGEGMCTADRRRTQAGNDVPAPRRSIRGQRE
jgi:hypothetical protein